MRAKNHRIGRYGLVVAATLTLATPGQARADFVLMGTEHLDVRTLHSMGFLFDSSTADVWQGGEILDASVNEQARLRILSGGYVYHLTAYNTSTVDISDGLVDFLWARDTSAVDISGGRLSNYLHAYNSSAVGISGGRLSSLYAHDSSAVDVSGGSMSWLYAYNASQVIFDGYDFRTTGALILDGERVLGTGVLTGKWFDGTSWAVNIDANDPTATILAIPEPATLGLLGLGMAGVLPRRRH